MISSDKIIEDYFTSVYQENIELRKKQELEKKPEPRVAYEDILKSDQLVDAKSEQEVKRKLIEENERALIERQKKETEQKLLETQRQQLEIEKSKQPPSPIRLTPSLNDKIQSEPSEPLVQNTTNKPTEVTQKKIESKVKKPKPTSTREDDLDDCSVM